MKHPAHPRPRELGRGLAAGSPSLGPPPASPATLLLLLRPHHAGRGAPHAIPGAFSVYTKITRQLMAGGIHGTAPHPDGAKSTRLSGQAWKPQSQDASGGQVPESWSTQWLHSQTSGPRG